MAKWRPAPYADWGNPSDGASVNNLAYGQRMGLMLDSQANRFFQQDPATMVNLAQSNLSDSDMLETMLTASDQVALNEMRGFMESLPERMQPSEFNRLPQTTRRLLTGAGYQIPEPKEDKPLWQRIATWDWPLIPEEFLYKNPIIGSDTFAGAVVKGALALPRAVGFATGKVAGGIWENVVMKPSRFAQRLSRWGNYLDDLDDPWSFHKPGLWREAWNKVKIESDSFSKEAVEHSIDLIGPEATMLLRKSISEDGVAGVYEYFTEKGKAEGRSISWVNDKYLAWYKTLTSADSLAARTSLESRRLDSFHYSIRKYNRSNLFLPDATPENIMGKAVGFTGAMAVEILLDPTMYMGGFYVKVIKRARAGLRGGGTAPFQLHFWENMTALEHVADPGTKVPFAGYGAFKEGLKGYGDEVMEWAKDHRQLRSLGLINISLRAQARGQNKMINLLNETFRDIDEIKEAMLRIKQTRAAEGLPSLDAVVLEREAMHLTGKTNKIADLSRMFPGLDPIIPEMLQWHERARDTTVMLVKTSEEGAKKIKFVDAWSGGLKKGDVIIGADGGYITLGDDLLSPIPRAARASVPTMSSRQGYWRFMGDAQGQKALTTTAGGVNPEAMFFPKIGYMGSKWVEGKKYMRRTIKFGERDSEVMADMARLTANWMKEKTDYVVARVIADVEDGLVQVSRKISGEDVFRILNEPDDMAALAYARAAGLSRDDLVTLRGHMDGIQKDAHLNILDDGDFSELYGYYQAQGYEFIKNPLPGGQAVALRRPSFPVPFKGAFRAGGHYYRDRGIHAASSLNGEVSIAERMGWFTGAAATTAAYYPARFAEKLFSYTPRLPYLDVMDNNTSIREFKGLIDIGIMAHIPRADLDDMLRQFIMGNESQRWVVQTQFFLDFMGRSGALLHGGQDVQEYIRKFIRHGNAHYSVLGLDDVSMYGVNIKRGIIGAPAHEAHLSRMNVIPDYRQLAAVAHYMSWYRMIGWGLHLPHIDKMISRTWRPAVLLRLGYVFRNGGEELFSWWLREGPMHWTHQKMARSASNQVVVWDGYGRKVVKDLNKMDKAFHESILWKPISRLWRSFNEVVGIGDFAITTKAVKESIEETGMRWAFLSADEQAEIFETNRRLVKARIEKQPLGRVGRGMFEMGNRYANMVAELTSRVSRKMGIPSRREMSERILRGTDPYHELRIELSTMAMLKPTILDEQMKQILGAYDTYLNFEKNSLSNVLRQQGVGSTVPALLKLPIDYTGTNVRWVQNSSAGDNPFDKSVALSQFAQHLNDSPENQAFVREMLHFASEQQDAGFDEIAQRLVDSLGLDIHKARFVGSEGRPIQVIPGDPGVVMHTIPVKSSHLDAPSDPITVVITGPRPKPTTKLPDGTVVKRPPLTKEDQTRIKRAIRDSLKALPPGSTVRVGGAQGVDQWAEHIANDLIHKGQDLNVQQYYVPPKGHPESWDSMKGGAGPNRNSRMLEGRQLGEGHATEAGVPDVQHGRADATFAFHPRPGKGFGEGASQKPQIHTTGLTARGYKFLTGTMRGPRSYRSKRLVVPFSQLMDKAEFAGKMPKAGVVIGLEGMVDGKRARVLLKIKNVSTLKAGEFKIAKNFNEFGVAQDGRVFVQPYDMHLTKDPDRTLNRIQQSAATGAPGRAPQDVTIVRTLPDGTPEEVVIKQGDMIRSEEYNQLAVFEVEYLGPRATTDADAKLLREAGRGSGTEDAMRQSFSAGISIDEGANMGRPDIVPEGAAEGGRYKNLKKQYEGEGHNVIESIEGDQTVMRVHQGGTQVPEQIIPPVPATPGMTPSQIVMTLLQEANPDIPYILRKALLTSSSEHGALALAWADAVDEVIPMFPPTQRAIWEDLLRPPVGKITEPGEQILIGGTVTTVNGVSNVHHGLGENRVLSNLDDAPFFFRGEKFQTAEGAYQAWKAGTGERAVGFHNVTGQVAKSQGRGMPVDQTTNVDLMREILEAKYEQVPQFRAALSEAGTITHQGRGIDAFWGKKYPELLEELRAGKPRRASGMEVRLVDEPFDMGPSGRSPAVTRMEDGKPTILFDPERAIGQYKDRTVVEGGGGASLRDDMGVDIEHFMDSFGPEGLIQLTPNDVTHPEKFLEVINEWRKSRGLRPLALDETLDGEFAFMAYIWEHEMAHIRLDHPNLKDMPRKAKEMQANTAAIEQLGIPRAALNSDSSKITMAGDGADRTVEMAGAKVEHFKGEAAHLTDVDSLDAHIRSLDPSPIDENYKTTRGNNPETPPIDGWQDSHLNIDAVENARKSGGDVRRVAESKPQTRLMGDPGSTYHYTGKTFAAQPWTPEMTEIKEAIERLTGYEFDLVLIQRYATGRTDLGRHFDRAGSTAAEQALKNPEQVVVSVNFGEAREFKFTPRRKGSEEPGLGTGAEYKDFQGGRYAPEPRPDGPTFTLENGDILVMMEGTNQNWAHTLSKDVGIDGLRINLTFRRVNPELAATPRKEMPSPVASPALPPAPPVFVKGEPRVTGTMRNRDEIDVQTAHWLASSPEIDPKRISGDIDEMVDRSKKAYEGQAGSPEGQQVAHSMVRSTLGSSQDSPYVSNPHPDSILRMFVPFIPVELVDELHDIVAGINVTEEGAGAFKAAFIDRLSGKLSALGVPKAEFVAFQTSNLLSPAVTVNQGATAMIYPQMAAHYAEIGQHFPLVTASANPMVAKAIAETFLEIIAGQRGVPVETMGPARVASRDVVGDEFYNDWGRFSREREANLPQDTIEIERGGIVTETSGAHRADQVPTLGVSYYGYKPDGPAPASAFGENGLKGQQVFGVSAGKLIPVPGGPAPVGIVNDTLKADAVRLYKHKSGNRPPAQVLPGSERNLDWFDDDWEMVSETFTTNDNLFDFISQQADTMSLETMHYLSNMSRGGRPQVFFPWMREVLDSGGVDAGRVQMMAERGAWWDQAPEHLLGYVPITSEEGNIFARGWHSVLRNWFDGVVNPMIGAMVREPLFHHYLTLGWRQTEDIRLLYNHKVGRYENLEKMLPGHISKDANQQLVINPLESFIKYDWPMAQADPEDLVSRLAFAINDEDPVKFINVVDAMFEKAADGTAYVDDMTEGLKDVLVRLSSTAAHGEDGHIYDFFKWAKNRKITEEIHLEHALSRAMTLTSAFIDDHRIRSQFQKMVGSAIPFWFAEDQFLRRLGRGLAHNPMMLRRLHLTMNAGVYSGLVDEDQHGNKILIIPGNEIITNAMLEIADRFPIVNKFFGGPLGAVMRPSLGTSLKVIPGYDLEQMGNMGFGPLLSVPINLIANRDARIRPAFEKNLIGGRFTPERGGNIIWQSIVPAIIARPLALAMVSIGIEDQAAIKAQQDVIRYMYLTEQLPTEEEIAAQPNPDLYMDQLMDQIAQAGRQYMLLQALSWFGGPAVGRLQKLMTNDAWEWNEEFYQMLEGGIPYEEAYLAWMENIVAREGEFDPYKYSPFRVSTTEKVPFSVIESTQAANEWIAGNPMFIDDYPQLSTFFMPRAFEGDDDDYSSEARSRAIARGLRVTSNPREFLERLIFNITFPKFVQMRTEHQTRRYMMEARGQDTTQLDLVWDSNMNMFNKANPIFMAHYQSGNAREKRVVALNEAELLLADPSRIPDGPYNGDILAALEVWVTFSKTMRDLKGAPGRDATDERNLARLIAYDRMKKMVKGRPWLNEIYYSLFIPALGDTWLAQYNAGLIQGSRTGVSV